jgi:hypothetical protein
MANSNCRCLPFGKSYVVFNISDLPFVLLVNKCGTCMVQVASSTLTVETQQSATFSQGKGGRGLCSVSMGTSVNADQLTNRHLLSVIDGIFFNDLDMFVN